MYISKVFTPKGEFTDGIEGPASDKLGNIYAVNFNVQGTIGKINPQGISELFVTLPQGSIGNGIRFRSNQEMLVADYTGHNILSVSMVDRSIKVYAHEDQLHQPNDIAIGANGIVFASDPDWINGNGRIWKAKNGYFSLLADEMGTTNGIEVSPDENKLYVNESLQRRVWVFDLDDRGNITNKRLLIEFPDYGLDGMRCDSRGNLFITRWGKGTVAMVSPDGKVLREIKLLGVNCTNLTFGGPDGCTVYVTVADQGNLEYFRTEFSGRLTE